MLRDYVMKQDLIREMNSVNQKLDKIWEFLNAYLISQKLGNSNPRRSTSSINI